VVGKWTVIRDVEFDFDGIELRARELPAHGHDRLCHFAGGRWQSSLAP
jgi:hypothetical protein